jgi:hypothetical protein
MKIPTWKPYTHFFCQRFLGNQIELNLQLLQYSPTPIEFTTNKNLSLKLGKSYSQFWMGHPLFSWWESSCEGRGSNLSSPSDGGDGAPMDLVQCSQWNLQSEPWLWTPTCNHGFQVKNYYNSLQPEKNEEIVNHLLLNCEFTSDLWYLVLNLFGVLWVMPSNILGVLHCWKTQGRGHSDGAIWKVIHALLMWSIWRETNRHLFADYESNVVCLKSLFLRSLLDWAVAYVPNFSSNLVGIVNFLDFRHH